MLIWKYFNQKIAIKKAYEAIYNNIQKFGLSKAMSPEQVIKETHSSQDRTYLKK